MIIRSFPRKVRIRAAVLCRALPSASLKFIRQDTAGPDYSESGADIAFTLRADSVDIVTPARFPRPGQPHDWVFPDTSQGIAAAQDAGATLLWANTLTSSGHPIERVMRDVGIVGELPSFMERLTDRSFTNAMLARNGIPIPLSLPICRTTRQGVIGVDHLRPRHLTEARLTFPVAVKLARRGTGFKVCLARDFDQLCEIVSPLLNGIFFEDVVMLEQFLPGQELIVVVLPQRDASRSNVNMTRCFALPPVARSNPLKVDGGGGLDSVPSFVPVPQYRAKQNDVQRLINFSRKACALVGALAPVAVNCRADTTGQLQVFGVRMNPDMSGPGRPGREHVIAAAALAAELFGLDYPAFLQQVLAQAWLVEWGDPLQLYSDLR